MPELPEVQTVVDTLSNFILNKKIKDIDIIKDNLIANLAADEFKERLINLSIDNIYRRGKYIVIELNNTSYLVGHLRMTGYFFYTEDSNQSKKYDCIVFKFTDNSELKVGSKRKFTRIYLVDDLKNAGSLTKLGPEPLSNEFTLEKFKEMLAKRKGRIKPLLLNQRFLAGLGNIYVDESLFIAKVHPLRKANTLKGGEVEELYKAIRQVLSEGIKHRGTTKWDYVDASGQSGSYQNYLRVYDREGEECIECGNKLDRIKVGGRSSYFCLNCQQQEE